MQSDFKERLRFQEADKRVKRIKNFYMRLGVYCCVNAIFLTVWTLDSSLPDSFWIPTLFFVTVVAGLLVLSNALILYGEKYILPKRWEERKLKKLMEKGKRQIIKYE